MNHRIPEPVVTLGTRMLKMSQMNTPLLNGVENREREPHGDGEAFRPAVHQDSSQPYISRPK